MQLRDAREVKCAGVEASFAFGDDEKFHVAIREIVHRIFFCR